MSIEETDLLRMAKRKLRIDVDDKADDQRISEIVEGSQAVLRDLLAIPDSFDFAEPGYERDLLLARVFYEWNDALDDFEANYAQALTTVREKWIVRAYAGSKEASADV